MNFSKPVDISKSSLISLKAELSRKQDEVRKSKSSKSASEYVSHHSKSEKNIFLKQKHKKGVKIDKIELNEDKQITDEDDETLKKSREVLELKSKLYDHLQDKTFTTDRGKSEYLVNFDQKSIDSDKLNRLNEKNSIIEKFEEDRIRKCWNTDQEFTIGTKATSSQETSQKMEDQEEKDLKNIDVRYQDSFSDDYEFEDEDDWVKFTDALGRSRKCLRKDLQFMKERNSELEKRLNPQQTSVVSEESSSQQLTSNDMQREMMRRKWEEQEEKLMKKTDVHYQDLLFDEVRTHGVGYYNFSTDEDERKRQQEELLKLRQETLKSQEEAENLKNRRNQKLQDRLKAARMRNRKRLGLDPEKEEVKLDEPDTDISSDKTQNNDGKEDDSEHKRLENLEKSLKRAAHVRPWDVGKDGVKTQPVMSQEEWVEKKREERISEFAPPSSLTTESVEETLLPPKRNRTGLFFTSKKLKIASESASDKTASSNRCSSAYKNELPYYLEEIVDDVKQINKSTHNKGVEIAPPLTMEYFGGDSRKRDLGNKSNIADIADSISVGMKYLEKQNKQKEKMKEKGLLDII